MRGDTSSGEILQEKILEEQILVRPTTVFEI